jgi:hypothetical protein
MAGQRPALVAAIELPAVAVLGLHLTVRVCVRPAIITRTQWHAGGKYGAKSAQASSCGGCTGTRA